jgi:hypothetical protein
MANSSYSAQSLRNKRSQKGEAEVLVFGIVVLIAALISGTFWVLQWVKENKYAEREERRKMALAALTKGPFKPRRDPAEYVVHCDKSGWMVMQTKYPCEVMPESYGEIFLMPE